MSERLGPNVVATLASAASAVAAESKIPPESAASVSRKKRPPPPDTPENTCTRSLVILSFWVVVITVGLPLWWITTAIYRAPLPLKEMQSWADGRACRAEFPLLIDVEAPTLPDPENLLKTVQHALDDANDFSAHHLRLRLSTNSSQVEDGEEESVAATLRLSQGAAGSPHSYVLSPSSRAIDLLYSPSYNPTSLSAFVASTLQEIFAEEQQMISYLLASSAPAPSPSPSSGGGNGGNGVKVVNKVNTAEVAGKMSRIVKYSPMYHLTFSLFTAAGDPSSWEIEEAVSEYLQPLLDALGGISGFTVDSQIQFYASLSSSVVPTWVPEEEEEGASGKYTLKKEDLSSFINSAEWPLVSITSYPTINFIIYIPATDQSPLMIPTSSTNAFLLPQWGGVMIHNPPAESDNTHLTKEALKPALDIFATQLLSLLGAPTHPASLPIRLDSLTRQRSAELLVSASSTLGSLYRLTLALPSISIPSSVSTSVSSTLSSLTAACQELRHGRFGGALEEGRNAEEQAEKAFFEKSMVGQVYFPEEHKVAVYLPLMGPVGAPLLMAALKEISRLVRVWKASKLKK
ncbi:phosphatidylinositol-glycan biosynthesis class S protein [Tuber brumale]|nr:phosphatidylinositol-glycan biosynthesis class S protein [Tuber brumale]